MASVQALQVQTEATQVQAPVGCFKWSENAASETELPGGVCGGGGDQIVWGQNGTLPFASYALVQEMSSSSA